MRTARQVAMTFEGTTHDMRQWADDRCTDLGRSIDAAITAENTEQITADARAQLVRFHAVSGNIL